MSIALVVGSSEKVWAEVMYAFTLAEYKEVFCVNATGAFWVGNFAWVTLHPDQLVIFKTMRKNNGLQGHYYTIGPIGSDCDFQLSYLWEGMIDSGSSGLFAVKAALNSYDKVVCAGIPMQSISGHFLRKNIWDACDGFRRGWEQALPHIEGRVKSLSGWTQQLLGAPTPEWLGSSLRGESHG